MISDDEFWELFIPCLFAKGIHSLPPNNTVEFGNTTFGSGFGIPWKNKTRYGKLTSHFFDPLKDKMQFPDGSTYREANSEPDLELAAPFGAWWRASNKTYMSIDANRDTYMNFQWDLQEPLPDKFLNIAKVFLDFGTLEHVKNQYPAWKNAHDVCSENCIMIHSLPADKEGSHVDHCYHWYTIDFFKELSEKCGYEVCLLDEVSIRHNPSDQCIWACMEKINNDEFISEEDFNEILEKHARSEYEDRPGGNTRHGIDEKYYHAVKDR